MVAPTTLLALLSSFALPVFASHNHLRRTHHQAAADLEARRLLELEERMRAFTATTTIFVEATRTQTVWVLPSEQVVFDPDPVDETTAITSATSAEVSSPAAQSMSSSESGSTVLSGSNAPSPSRASGSGPARSSPAPTASASSLTDAGFSSSHPSGSPHVASITDSATSKSRSNAPTYSRSSGSGEPQPKPTASSSSPYESSSAYDSSLAVESASSSSLDPHETLWTMSASSVVSSATGSADADYASSSYSAVSSSSAISSAWESSSAAPSSTSSASASSNTLAPLGKRLMNAYYPDWSAWYIPPESVDWSKYDVLDFAFALPTQDGNLQFTQDDSSDSLHRLVTAGHAAGKRVKLSIGGWTGSAYFSTICASDSLRATFVANILKAYKAYNIDGIDIDWEYPGVSGASGNAVSSSDSDNYLTFLQDLRAALPAGALITTATQVWPFAGGNGSPLTDVSGFAKVLDWILIMNYDIWGSSSTPGPNAPLSDACGNSTQPLANAYAAISSWTTAGMPANKITLGVPAYGYLSGSSATSLRQRRSHFPSPPHKRQLASDLAARADVTVYNGNGGTTDGQVMFYSLLSQGALGPDGNGGYTGAGGFTRQWDSCSSTPWLKSDATGQIITYDDTESMSLKGQFAAQAGILGCNVFSIDGDYTNGGFPLTDAVRSGLGL